MYKTHKKAGSLTAALITFGSLVGGANAAITVTNWNISGNDVSFTISGDIEVGSTIGFNNPSYLLIGVPGDTDWISSGGNSSTVNNLGGATVNVTGAGYSDFPSGDVVGVMKPVGSWAIGDSVNASITITGGTLIGANIDTSNIILISAVGIMEFPPQSL